MSQPPAVPLAPVTPIISWIRRSPTTAFLILAYPIFWTIFLPAFADSDLARPLSAVGAVLGLALPAFVVSVIAGGKVGAREFLWRCLRLPARPGTYLLAVFGLPLATILLAVPLHGPEVLTALKTNWPLLFTFFLPQVLLALVTIQLWEEAAWAGFVQHHLQGRQHPLGATTLVALGFAWIHLPTYFLGAPFTAERIPAVLLMMLPVTVFALFFRALLAWVYNHWQRSVPLAALLHASFNTVSSEPFARSFIPGPQAAWLPLLTVVILAAVVVLVTKGRLGHVPGAPRGLEH
jgi:membrane protease YdiL (CAAX protease family)